MRLSLSLERGHEGRIREVLQEDYVLFKYVQDMIMCSYPYNFWMLS